MESLNIRRQFSRVGLALFLLMLIQQVAVAVIAAVVGMVAPALQETDWFLWVVTYVPLYLIAFPVFLLVVRTIPDTVEEMPREYLADKKKISAKGTLLIFLAMIGVTCSLNLFSTWLSGLIEQLKGRPVTNFLEETVMGSNPWLTILMVVIVAPVMEEFIFRWILYKKLIVFGEKTYIFLSALLFALFHLNFYQLLYAFVLGLILAGVVCRTKSVAKSILLHFLVNLTGSGVGTLLNLSGNEQMMAVWGMAVMVAMLVGILIVIVWLFRYLRRMQYYPPLCEYKASMLWGNPGMLLYLVMSGGLAVFAVLL